MAIKETPNKITAVLKVTATAEFFDDEASEETVRYAIEQDLEDAGFDVDVSLMKEQEGLLGIQQTADSITFVSTGTAHQGEARGLLLGKLAMHEWLKKELLYRGLLTNDIRAVFDEAKRQEGR